MLETRDAKGIWQLQPVHFRNMFSVFYPDHHSSSVPSWMFEGFVNRYLEAKRPRKVFGIEGIWNKVNLSYTANLDHIHASTTKTAIIDLRVCIETIHYEKMADVQPCSEDRLYIPMSRNKPIFAFCKSGPASNPVIWLFQCITANKHDIKVEPFPTLMGWFYPIHYVAVVPGDFDGGHRTFTFALPKELHDTVKGMWVLPINPNELNVNDYYDD